MLKVIIADDERVIREGISELIDWKSLDLELIGLCKNGIEAYDMILDESPDIVMTDIKMPGMSGIELIERVAHTDPDVQFILLSGYGEFEYARAAMRNGVHHYLLKPCGIEQVVEALEAASRERYHKQAARLWERQYTAAQNTLCQNVMINVFNELAVAAGADHKKIYHPYRRYFDFEDTRYELSFLNGLREADLTDCFSAILEYHRHHAPNIPLYGIYVPGTLAVFCQGYSVERESLDALMESLSHRAQEKIFVRDARRFSNLRTLLDCVWDKVSPHGTITYLNDHRPLALCNYRGMIHSIKNLCFDICALQKSPLEVRRPAQKAKIRELKRNLNGVTNPDFLIQLCSSVLMTFSNASLFCTPVEATEWMMEMQNCNTADEMRKLFLPLLDRMVENTANISDQNELILRIQHCVSENLSNPDLTLKWIAEKHLYMNVDYVSRKFVKETGRKFSGYLTEMRIQRAKELLANGDSETIQAIAELVGSGNNPQYFSQIFKKNTGMTPTAYAKMMRG